MLKTFVAALIIWILALSGMGGKPRGYWRRLLIRPQNHTIFGSPVGGCSAAGYW
jgi:hypothetical protein